VNRFSHLALGLVVTAATAAGSVSMARPAAADGTSQICWPVEGPGDELPGVAPEATISWSDTFGAPRSGHSHEGQDLMSVRALKGRFLLAATAGVVQEVQLNQGKPTAGNRVVILGDDGNFYVYLHVNNDTPGTDDGMATFAQAFPAGITQGARVTAGQPVAYLGDSGNAEETGPHLHFEIRPRTAATHWSTQAPINPATMLRAAASCPSTRLAPFVSVDEVVQRQYLDVFNRAIDPSGRTYWSDRIHAGLDTPVTFITRLIGTPEFDATVAPVARLYWAYFLRIPDTDGLLYWMGQYAAGMKLTDISQRFSTSPEFQSQYSSAANDPGAFVDLVYGNVLGRSPDPDGRAYWVSQLTAGMSRGHMMTLFSESAEFVAKKASEVRVLGAYVGMLRRSPDPGGLAYWSSMGVAALVPGIYNQPEYRDRIASLR
jgi:hypothetical protein